MKMRIGLNLLHALPEIGGGWNYIANLLSALGECDNSNTYVAFVTSVSSSLVPEKPNFEKVCIKIDPVSRPQRIIYENSMLQLLAHRHQLNCMHWFGNVQALLNSVPGVVSVYDIHPFLKFANFAVLKRTYLKLMLYLTSKRAHVLLPISHATADDLQRVSRADPARMIVITVILGPQFKPASDEKMVSFRLKYGLPEYFWLYVAHLLPYKNHVQLLKGYHRLKMNRGNPWPLVLRGDNRGSEKDIMKTIMQLNLLEDVIQLPRLDEVEMPMLYSSATALVFPSLYEGCGIPVVEAMACGCPVLASKMPVMEEFGGDAVSYFDPNDMISIEHAMGTFQKNPKERERGHLAGLKRSQEFRSQEVVSRLLNAYRFACQRSQ